MKMNRYYILLFFILVITVNGSSDKSLPSFILNNWSEENALLVAWSSGSDCPQKAPCRFPGTKTVRHVGDLSASLLSSDTFALEIDGVLFADPLQFSSDSGGGTILETTGELHTTYTTYSKNLLPISLRRSYYVPNGEQFYLVSYMLKAEDGKTHSVSLLDLVQSDIPGSYHAIDQNCAHGYWKNGSGVFLIDMSGCGSLAAAVGEMTGQAQHQVGDKEGTEVMTNPLVSFAACGNLTGNSDWKSDRISIGYAMTNISVSDQPLVMHYYRVFSKSVDNVMNIVQRVISKKPEEWISITADAHKQWLQQSSVQPDLSGNAKDFYDKTLLSFKHAINPALGTFVASFHPLYEYKVWSRDGTFAAMILSFAGYPDEAAKYLKWAASAKLRDDGAFHTCYDTFTGEPVGFVEPQYDGTGAFALAVLCHVHLYGGRILDSVYERLKEFENFYLNSVGHYDLAPSDYSIWEESSDPHSGKPLATSYFTFTQSMVFAGTRAAALIEVEQGGGKNSTRSLELFNRSESIRNAVKEHLWNTTNQSYNRGIWSDSLQVDGRADSASVATVFTGLEGEVVRAKSHVSYISKILSVLGSGISRYENDPFFYDSIYSPCAEYQVGAAAPPWPVTSMFTAWSELLLGESSSAQQRVGWCVEHSALGNMPVGEAVDGVTGNFVSASAPDLYEGGGVAVLSVLLIQELAPSFVQILQN